MGSEVSGVREISLGDRMPDGTIYAGISPDTGKQMYAAAEDAPGTRKWRGAMYAAGCDREGRSDWRLPTRNELNVLFNNRAAIGGFKQSGPVGERLYWSSTFDGRGAWAKCFSNGGEMKCAKDRIQLSVRLVRG